MGRSRGRLLAVAIVLGSMVGTTLALQVWPSVPGPESNPAIPVSQNGRLVFSLRNDTGSAETITGFTKPLPAAGTDGCPNMGLPVPLDPGQSLPLTLAPGAQAQFVISTTSPFTVTGDPSCTYDVQTTVSTTPPQITATFHVVASEDVDVQPPRMNFGNQVSTNTEKQTVAVTSWGGAQQVSVELVNDTNNQFELADCNGSATLCNITLPGSGGFGSANVRCKATPGYGSAMVVVYDMSNQYGSAFVECTGAAGSGSGSGLLSIMPNPLMLSAAQGQTTQAMETVSGSGGSITSIAVNGGMGTLEVVECMGVSSCSVAMTLPATLNVRCTPTATQQMATLVVSGPGGSGTSNLSCTPTTSGGQLVVMPSALDFGGVPVGGEGSGIFTVGNVGGADLTNVQLVLGGANSTHYAVSDCTQAAPCTLVPTEMKPITVYFRPLSHGDKPAALTVSGGGSGSGSNGMIDSVSLTGTGVGGVQVVTAPPGPTYHLDFGTLPRTQQGSATLTVRNDGNALLTAAVSGVSAPYAIDQSAQGVPETQARSFTVTCGSPTASAANDQTWTVSSDAYTGTPTTVTVSCAIADTMVTVDPLAFDFGEVRTGSPAQERTLTVTNPGPGSATITSIALHEPKQGLALVPPSTMTTLAAGSSATAVLRLTTASDTDLANESVDIVVDGTTLALPVRGKVVTAHSQIVPARLDLGTACVGTPVAGTVRLVNDGTATLAVDAPQPSASFTATSAGLQWPLSLPPGMSASTEVSPTTSASGAIAGTLGWHDDVPSEYSVPIALEYVTSGTALSPRGLDFGTVVVDGDVPTQRVMLENCDLAPSKILVKSLRGLKGPIGAWELEPRVGFEKTLATHERQAVLVSFKPPGRGHYEAEIRVATEGGEQTIVLAGDATGRAFDSTSFYTCACSSDGEPWRGWPIVLALVVVSARRRRGSSSAR